MITISTLGAFQFVFGLLPYGQRILDVRIFLLIYMPYGQRILDVQIVLLIYMPYGQLDFLLGKQCQ